MVAFHFVRTLAALALAALGLSLLIAWSIVGSSHGHGDFSGFGDGIAAGAVAAIGAFVAAALWIAAVTCHWAALWRRRDQDISAKSALITSLLLGLLPAFVAVVALISTADQIFR